MRWGRLEREGGVRVRWVRDGKKECRGEGSADLSGSMWEWREVGRGGGGLQLRGNLFLLFSPNKGCDWLHCVRTDLLHAGNKASEKGWFTAKSQQQQDITMFSMNQADRRSLSFITAHILSHANNAQFRFFYSLTPWANNKTKTRWGEQVLFEMGAGFVFPMQNHTQRMGRLFHPPSQKNVNKPAFKYNDLQHRHWAG